MNIGKPKNKMKKRLGPQTRTISVIALVISAVSLGWTIFNQQAQNKRSDALNSAAITPTEVGFYAWREISEADRQQLNQGFPSYQVEARSFSRRSRVSA